MTYHDKSNDQHFQNPLWHKYILNNNIFLPNKGLNHKAIRTLKNCSNIIVSLPFVHKKYRPTSKIPWQKEAMTQITWPIFVDSMQISYHCPNSNVVIMSNVFNLYTQTSRNENILLNIRYIWQSVVLCHISKTQMIITSFCRSRAENF